MARKPSQRRRRKRRVPQRRLSTAELVRSVRRELPPPTRAAGGRSRAYSRARERARERAVLEDEGGGC